MVSSDGTLLMRLKRAIRIAAIVQQEMVAPCGPGIIVDHVTAIM
jgi:hypothetical protein